VTIGELWFDDGRLDWQPRHSAGAESSCTSARPSPLMVRARQSPAGDASRLLVRYDQAIAHLQVAMDGCLMSLALRHPSSEQPVSTGFFYRISPGIRGEQAIAAAMRYDSRPQRSLNACCCWSRRQVWLAHHAAPIHKKQRWPLRQLQQLATERGDRSNQAFAMHMNGLSARLGRAGLEAIRLLEQAPNCTWRWRPIPRNNERAGPGHILSGARKLRSRSITHARHRQTDATHVRGVLSLGYLNKGMIALFRGEWQECEELLPIGHR